MIAALLSQSWVEWLGWTLVHFLWQGTAVAVLYAVLRGALGRSLSAQGRYTLACLALGTMTAAPPLTFLLIPMASGTAAPGWWVIPAFGWQKMFPWVVVGWMLGVAVFSIRLVAGWRFTVRLRAASHPAPPEWQQVVQRTAARVGATRPVRLLVSSVAEVPMVIGWLRPAILVPLGSLTGLPLEHMTALLAHELAHVRRQDYLAGILQGVAESLLFYHPAVWWVSRQIRAEREACCDDVAVTACGDVVTYARALAELESQRAPRLSPALAASGGSLLDRVRRLIEPPPATNSLPGSGALWAMSLLWIAGVGAATAAQAALVPAPRVDAPRPMVLPAAPASSVVKALLYDPLLPLPQAPASEKKKTARMEGRVVTQSGAPVPRATVQLLSGGVMMVSKELYATTTDEGGSFTLDDIQPGRYTLQVSKAGFMSGGFGGTLEALGSTAFSLEAGQKVTDAVVTLITQGVIAGQVTNQDGEPVPNVSVTAWREVYFGGRKVYRDQGRARVTDDEGMYRIATLPPGHYYLQAVPERVGFPRATNRRAAADTRTVYPNALNVAAAARLELAPGARLEGIDIRLRREFLYSVSGKVTLNGAPAEATVYVFPSGVSLGGRVASAPVWKGVFEIRDLPPGPYVVTARPGIEPPVVITPPGSPPPDRSAPSLRARAEITIENSDAQGLNLALEPGIEVTGLFRAESGSLEELAKSASPRDLAANPLEVAMAGGASASAGVNFEMANPSFRPLFRLQPESGTADMSGGLAVMMDDGSFRISGALMAPGRYFWEVNNLPDNMYVKSVRCDEVDVTQSPMSLMSGSKVEIVLSGKAGAITGRLRNEKDEPLRGVTVTAWPRQYGPGSPLSSVKSRSSEADGSFRIGGLTPGEYYVIAWEGEPVSSGIIRFPEFLAAFTRDAETVDFDEGGTARADVKVVPSAKIAAAAAKLP